MCLSPQTLLSWACLHVLPYLHICNFIEFAQKAISNHLSNLYETSQDIQNHLGGLAHLHWRTDIRSMVKTPPAVQHLHCCEPEELHRTSTVPSALGWDPTERSRVLAVPVPWRLSQPQPSTPEQLCPPEAVTPSSSVGATIPCKQRPTSRCSNGLKARHGALLYGQR